MTAISSGGTSSIAIGQMVCIEFATRGSRAVRLLGCLAEATDDHLLVDSLEGSTMRPQVGESVVVSILLGRAVTQAGTTVLHGSETGSRRLMVRCPLAFLEGNRRRHNRLGTRVPLEWFEIGRGPNAWAEGQTTDISIGGLQYVTRSDQVAAGDRVVLILGLPSRKVATVCEVRSARPDPGGTRVGVQFVALGDLDRAALAQLGL
jgi:hypothetical protein